MNYKEGVFQMLIAILVLSGLSALGSLLGAGALMLVVFYTWEEIRDEKRAATEQKAAAKKQNINGEN